MFLHCNYRYAMIQCNILKMIAYCCVKSNFIKRWFNNCNELGISSQNSPQIHLSEDQPISHQDLCLCKPSLPVLCNITTVNTSIYYIAITFSSNYIRNVFNINRKANISDKLY